MQRIRYTHAQVKQATPTAFLPALAALSNFAAAMNSRTLIFSARYWLPDALRAGFPAFIFPFGLQVLKLSAPRITYDP